MGSKENKYGWKDITVFLGGVEIKEITQVQYSELIKVSDLESELLIAKENEQYELCAKLKRQIDEFK
ncbi:hypothetical protein [Flavobacterium aestivum]|uniref:hypothetical protein n=1 Tax=Flavobacterium aestivum TaxID=3003257 RepID=UPI0022854575|nr:hypothetical protein [Flavobacterium aestivum]